MLHFYAVITAFYGDTEGVELGAYFSPDGMNLAGGGGTVRVYLDKPRVAAVKRVGSGVLTAFHNPSDQSSAGIFYSIGDGALGGGGTTVPVSP